jgi:hypothetical protein
VEEVVVVVHPADGVEGESEVVVTMVVAMEDVMAVDSMAEVETVVA